MLQENKDYGPSAYRELFILLPVVFPFPVGLCTLCFLPSGYMGFFCVPFDEFPTPCLNQLKWTSASCRNQPSAETIETKFRSKLFPLNLSRRFAHSRGSVNPWQCVYLFAIYTSPSPITGSVFAQEVIIICLFLSAFT